MKTPDRDTLFKEADDLFEKGEHVEAFELFRMLAECGDSSAMTRLAVIYFCGEGVEKNIDESIKWDIRAIEAGDIAAMTNLAITYASLREFRKARHWFERAVEMGDGDAAFDLAKLLDVSEFERTRVKGLLLDVISAKLCSTPYTVELAEAFITELDNRA
jgi:uncharacterized protein